MKIKSVSGAFTICSNLSRIETSKTGVTVEVDTTSESAVITLPPSGTYPKITVVDASNNCSVNNIRILPATDEDIEGEEDITMNKNGDSMDFFPGSDAKVLSPDTIQPSDEKIITLSGTLEPADITSLADNIEILPALTGKKRYDLIEVRFEYQPGMTLFTFTDDIVLDYGGLSNLTVPGSLINSPATRGMTIRDFTDVVNYATDISIGSSGVSPTNGTGTLEYFVVYKIVDYTFVG